MIALGLPLASRLDPRAVAPPALWLLAAFLASAVLSLLQTGPAIGLLPLIQTVILAGVFVVGAGEDSLDGVMIGLTAGLVPSIALTIPQSLGWSPVTEGPAPAGLFYNRDILGELAAPIFVWWALRRSWVAIVLSVPLVLCGSRVSWFAAAVGLLYAVPLCASWKIAGATIATPVFAALGFAFGPERLHTAGERVIIWKTALDHVTPLGHGIGWFAAAFPLYQTAHSDVLQWIVDLGVGAGPLMALALAGLVGCEGARPAERAVFAAVLLETAVSFPLHLPATGFLAAVVAGYMARRYAAARRDESVERPTDGTGAELA